MLRIKFEFPGCAFKVANGGDTIDRRSLADIFVLIISNRHGKYPDYTSHVMWRLSVGSPRNSGQLLHFRSLPRYRALRAVERLLRQSESRYYLYFYFTSNFAGATFSLSLFLPFSGFSHSCVVRRLFISSLRFPSRAISEKGKKRKEERVQAPGEKLARAWCVAAGLKATGTYS